jgi:KaiC/GvpD/RAD55 family RecA-like ATPase
MGDIKEKFRDSVKDLQEYIAIATIPAKEYQKANSSIIKELVQKQNIPGVYVTLSKPYATVEQALKKEGIDTRMVLFIDAVTKTVKDSVKKTKQCLFIGSPENLSDISLAMDQAVRSLPSKDKFVFFDSLSILLMYNEIDTVARFIHFLATKMRAWKVKGIIVSLTKEKDKELIDELMQFCDVFLEFGN